MTEFSGHSRSLAKKKWLQSFCRFLMFAGLCLLGLNVIFSATDNFFNSYAVVGHSMKVFEMASTDDSANHEKPVAPIITHALDQVDRAKKMNDLMSMMSQTFSNDCEECAKKVSEIRYEQCHSGNDYLEKQLADQVASSSLLGTLISRSVSAQSIIKSSCVRASLDLGSSHFRNCSGTKYGKQLTEPCLSEKYFKLVNNSFDVVATCMKDYIAANETDAEKKLDVRAIYALINIESGFQVNSVSATGAGGIGQLTAAAIADVNMNQLSGVRSSLDSSKFTNCRRISSEMLNSSQPIPSRASSSCERISIANGNPLKNMVYTFAYLRGVKEDLESQIFTNDRYSSKFKLSDVDLARVKRAMMVWSYNTGAAGIITPVKALLNLFYGNKVVTNADDFIESLQQYIQKFPAGANRSAFRRRETSRYFPKITDTLNSIERNIGGGSCVN